jgi:DNA-binding protein Fis
MSARENQLNSDVARSLPGREHELALQNMIEDQIAAGGPHLYRKTLQRVERLLLMRVLEKTRGSQQRAARILGITRGSLRHRIRLLGITITMTVNQVETPD